MTARIMINSRPTGCALSAMLAVCQTTMGRVIIATASEAEREQVRSTLFAGKAHGLVPGDEVQIGSGTFHVTTICPNERQVTYEQMPLATPQAEPRPAAKFDGDRPHLKRKKGRS